MNMTHPSIIESWKTGGLKKDEHEDDRPECACRTKINISNIAGTETPLNGTQCDLCGCYHCDECVATEAVVTTDSAYCIKCRDLVINNIISQLARLNFSLVGEQLLTMHEVGYRKEMTFDGPISLTIKV